MIYLEEKTSVLSKLIENQFPSYVQENNEKFLKFLSSYYESQETKYQPLDIVSNLVDYYNIAYFRKNQLVESTKLVSNTLATSTTLTVESTTGFPSKNGYIQVDNEIIFYKTKTSTTFVDCVRGTSALVLENVPKSDIFLKNSIAAEHLNGVKVKNIAYNYALEFFDRIKSELAPVIPETFASDLDIGNFLKNIKSFYSAKGSLNSHRIFFRILFNDRKFSVIFNNRGTGAEIKINNFGGAIPDPAVVGVKPQIVSGGSNYDNRKDTNGDLINPPVVDILGSGTGKIINGIRPNKTAIIKVTDIDTNGAITDIDVTDIGENYRGPIIAKVRPKNFEQDQNVYSASGTGVGKVDYFDPFTNELILYDVIGYFTPNDEIITNDGEKARGFIARSYQTPVASRNGVEVLSEEQNIEFPREYTFKTSDSEFSAKKVLRAKLIDGYFLPGDKLPNAITLIQDEDELFGVIGTNIEADNFTPLDNGVFEFEISTNSDIEQIYLQPTTTIVKSTTGITSSTTNLVLTADDTSRFPVQNGILLINGREIHYKSRTFNQFIDCKYYGTDTFDVNVKDRVISAGRIKYDQEWQSGQTILKNDFKYYGNNLYLAESDGITGSTAPSHTSGSVRDGSLALGDTNPVLWKYYSPNRYDYTLYINYNDNLIVNPRFEVIALPGQVVIESPGALHSKTKYEFARLDDPNIKVYNFTTNEISDRLAAVLGSNYNKNRDTVTDSRFPSYKRLTGFSTQHDYEDYIYVASSGIPRWWNDIVNTGNQTLTAEEQKKISFTDQKLLVRWNKSGLIYESQAFGAKKPTKKAIGLNIDAIQINSYKGNTVNYGFVDKFIIADGGNYPVPYTVSGSFDEQKYPALTIQDPVNSSNTINVTNNLGLFKISSKIVSIDFNTLASDVSFSPNLSGFITRPSIEVINENPRYDVTVTLNSTNVDITAREITIPSHQFNTTDLITYYDPQVNYFLSFKSGDQFFVRKVSNDKISLYRTKSDCLLNRNKVSLENIAIGNPTFSLLGQQRNPIDFEDARLELSFNNGVINNILIRNSGNGYVTAPTIKISGGGKPDILVPLQLNGNRIVEMAGKMVSATTYYLDNYYEVSNVSGGIFNNTSWDINPPVSFGNGAGATAVAYTSNGSIVSIVLIKRGSGYSIPPRVVVTGEGENGVIESIINSTGEVIGFNIVNGGTGYRTAPRIDIEPVGSGGLISCKLKEWTFNLKRQLSVYDRIDSYGGYVYDESDAKPSTNNPQEFTLINYDLDFPKGIDRKQYHLFTTTEKLLAKYTEEKDPFIAYFKTLNPGVTLTQAQVFSISGHSPAILVSYDGIPVYGSKKVLTIRNQSLLQPTDPNYQSQFSEIKSRYRLKYSTTAAPAGVDSSTYVVGGTTYYVYRTGGPSILEYPIGSFIEDYEYVVGGENDLDEHNGRFSITPEFPNGRYCYFNTYQSFDDVTNQIISSQNVDFGGFPYVIGNTFASTSDDYMNNRCRTNDKIPKFFTRIFEKEVDAIPGIFPGLPANDEYPQENIGLQKTIAETESIATGSVDSVIIESSGDGYRVGDRLNVDNSLTFGSGFSGIVSKVAGKPIVAITKSTDFKEVTFKTSQPNGLAIGDYVYFDYVRPSSPVDVYVHNNAASGPLSGNVLPVENPEIFIAENESVDKYNNKLLFNINLNFKYTYKINIPANVPFNLTYDIDKVNEFFILNEGQSAPIDHIILDVSNIPNRLYLHIDNYIYQINKTKDYYGPRRITAINTQTNTFRISFAESTKGYEETNILYSAKSYGATGPIREISISSKGSNYRSLPAVNGLIKKGTTNEVAGDGNAIIQANSNTIGRIRNVVYDSLGGGFDANINVNYYLNIPSTAKVINNFEIYDVEIVDGGNTYDDVTITAVEDGVTKPTTLKATVSLGTITKVEVVDGGTNFSKTPSLVVTAPQGSGAVLKAKIRRKNIFTGFSITTQVNSILFPVPVTGRVVNFDNRTSTLEFDEITGEFKENNTIYTDDGRPYGKVVSIRRTRAYAKAKPYAQLRSSRKDVTGNTSEYLQKITDSNYYQDWSYSITSSRDTIEWKKDQDLNTHPAGFKQFGKRLLERRKSVFTNPSEVFRSSVIFTTNLINEILLKAKLSPCREQRLFIQNPQDFSIGDYFYGSTSGAIGVVVSKTEYFVTLQVRGSSNFVVNEVLVEVSPEFAFGILSTTDKTFVFWNGVFQEPEESYEISASYSNSIETFVPKFTVNSTDEILTYRSTTSFDILDTQTLTAGSSSFSLNVNQSPYTVTSSNIEQFIISIGGSVQKPSNLSVTNNVINTTTPVSHNSNVFAVRHQNLSELTFTGPASGTVFTINQTPSDDCKLLIFHEGAFQSQLVTDFTVSGNQITFSETVDLSDIFGWYLDESVTCESLNINNLTKNKSIGIWDCVTKNFTQRIESNAIKSPESIYEIRKDQIDGTVYPQSSTEVLGFDTKFTYTSPQFSSSYVEILDAFTFNGSTKTFNLTRNKNAYTPSNGEESILVYINNQVLDQDQYSVSGSTITFVSAYAAGTECTVLNFISDYTSNTGNENGVHIDRLNVSQNGSRSTFNLSDRGVPKYVNNVGDIFVIKNGQLKIPLTSYLDHRNITLATHSINDNKITFTSAPQSSDIVNLAFFNRQLLPEPTKNVVLDRLICFDGSRTSFPITVDGIFFTPITVNHLFVIRNGVLQKPGLDYTISGGHNLVFATAPQDWEVIFSFYSYDGLNQNVVLETPKYFNGVAQSFALTRDYQSTTVDANQNALVFRNGVYQYPVVDYSITDGSTAPYITFTTAPTSSEGIFITNVKQTLVDATAYFSQVSSTEIQSNAPGGTYDDTIFLIFVNGLLQVGNSWSYSTGTITFASSVSLANDDVKIYAFTTAKRELDSISITNTSTLTYNLDFSSTQISNVSKASDLIVSIEGVVQEPDVAYTVTSSTITFIAPSLYQTGVDIYIYQVGDTTGDLTERIDYLDDNYSKSTQTVGGVSIETNKYKLLDGYQSFNPPNADDVFIIRNGVVQNPSEDFAVGNGTITFTTNISETDDLFIMYTHGTEELTISNTTSIDASTTSYTLSTSIASNEYDDIILYADGAPRFYQRGDFTVSNNDTLVLTHTTNITPQGVFVMKYPNVTVVDEYEDCPDGSRTRFKLLYNNQNLVAGNIVSDADILVSINGVVQNPGVQYTVSANRGFVDMSYAPQFNDEIFMVRMSGNLVRTLTPTGTAKQYTLSVSEPLEKENVVVFSNNTWKFAELGDFTWNNDSTITLSTAHTTGQLFAIKFFGVFNLLDQINTPFNGSNTKFNLFDGQENFVPVGTIDNDNNPDETSLIVIKNGKFLEPKVDYTLTGDIESQILFATAPAVNDVISVRSVGSFLKLDTITNSSGFLFDLRLNGTSYYPDSHIGRPRDLENQIVVIVDGNVASPIYDYFIFNNKIVFEYSLAPFNKMVILDFRGTSDDVKVYSRFNQVSIGDELFIAGEDSPRKVVNVHSPTVLETAAYIGDSPRNFQAYTTLDGVGGVQSVTITSSGLDFKDPVIVKTTGTGEGASFVAYTSEILGGTIVSGERLYPGYNVYNTHYVYPTVYASTYRKQQINKSQIRKGTKLTSNINSTVETIPLNNTFELPSNAPSITVSSSSGSGADFKVYVSGGEIRKIDILNGGSGYDDRDITVELTGGGGTGCVLEPVLNGSGTITDLIIRNNGVGYDTFRVIIHNVDNNNIVNAEVIEYTYVDSNGIDGCTRGVLGDAASHSQNDIVYFDNYL